MVENNLVENNLVEETLDELLSLLDENKPVFYKSYKSLPFEIYSEIERLSVSKSSLYRDLCAKAKIVAETFHKSIK